MQTCKPQIRQIMETHYIKESFCFSFHIITTQCAFQLQKLFVSNSPQFIPTEQNFKAPNTILKGVFYIKKRKKEKAHGISCSPEESLPIKSVNYFPFLSTNCSAFSLMRPPSTPPPQLESPRKSFISPHSLALPQFH